MGTYADILIAILFFIVGYVLGRIKTLKAVFVSDKPTSFFSNISKDKSKQIRNIEIDERKFVSDIKTDTYQKSFESLGKKTVTKDDVIASVSKLAQKKGIKQGEK